MMKTASKDMFHSKNVHGTVVLIKAEVSVGNKNSPFQINVHRVKP
jgi:hypothetical protein